MSQDIFSLWNNTHNLKDTSLTIKGYSRAGERSCFQIPAISLMFDAGVRTVNTPNHIFITHCHSDHFFDLPIILSGINNKKTNIYTPVNVGMVNNFIESSLLLINNGKNRRMPEYQINKVNPGQIINFSENKRDYQVEIFKCYHTVPALGFGLAEVKKKLKKEYYGKPGKEIAELKKTKDIFELVNQYIITYLTDTTIQVFDDHNIFKYKNIIVECTILEEEFKESAYNHKHIYWGDLLPIIKSHPENNFILIHISIRYNNEDIISFFDKVKEQEKISNVEPWLN